MYYVKLTESQVKSLMETKFNSNKNDHKLVLCFLMTHIILSFNFSTHINTQLSISYASYTSSI